MVKVGPPGHSRYPGRPVHSWVGKKKIKPLRFFTLILISFEIFENLLITSFNESLVCTSPTILSCPVSEINFRDGGKFEHWTFPLVSNYEDHRFQLITITYEFSRKNRKWEFGKCICISRAWRPLRKLWSFYYYNNNYYYYYQYTACSIRRIYYLLYWFVEGGGGRRPYWLINFRHSAESPLFPPLVQYAHYTINIIIFLL